MVRALRCKGLAPSYRRVIACRLRALCRSALAARLFGYKSAIAHGMSIVHLAAPALVAALHEREDGRGDDATRHHTRNAVGSKALRLSVAFVRPVPLPSVAVLECTRVKGEVGGRRACDRVDFVVRAAGGGGGAAGAKECISGSLEVVELD